MARGNLTVLDVLWERRSSALANALDVLDQIEFVVPDEKAHLRSSIMREINDLHDLAKALIEANGNNAFVNEHYLEMLSDIHNAVVPKTEDART